MTFEVEVRQSLTQLTASVRALESATKSSDRSLRSMATSAQAGARGTKALADATRKASDSAKELERRFKGVGQAITQAGGSLGGFGSRVSAFTEIAGKIGPAGLAAGGAAVAGGALLAGAADRDRIAQEQAGDVARRRFAGRRSLGDSALAALDGGRARVGEAFAGVDQGRAAAIARSGQAVSLDDARGGLAQLQDITDAAVRTEIERAAGLISRATGQSFSEAVAVLRAGRAEVAVQRGIAPGASDLAADALGMDRDEFRRRVSRAEGERSRLGLDQIEATRTRNDLATEGRATDTVAAIQALNAQLRELVDPVGAGAREQLIVLREQAKVQNNLLAAFQDLRQALLLAGEGSARTRAAALESTVQQARAAAASGSY